MKYLQIHPIHEDFNAMDNPHKKHSDSELKKTHADAEKYAGVGKQSKKPVEGKHNISNIALTKGGGGKSTIAGQNGVSADIEQRLAKKEAEYKANAKSIAGQNGAAQTDEEQRLSHIAENKIIRFNNFN